MFKKWKGFWIFVVGIIFNILETAYYGWGTPTGINVIAMSIGEMVCDYIALILMVLGGF